MARIKLKLPKTHLLDLVRVQGFTVVELLIVIVVIGILATLTVIAYRGITGSAIDAAGAWDAKSIASQLEATKARTGSYPSNLASIITDQDFTHRYTGSGDIYCSTTINSSGYESYTSYTNTNAITGRCPGHANSQSRIVTGNLFSCALLTNGGSYCWGDNAYGQIGRSGGDALTAAAVDTSGVLSGDVVSAISGGIGHTCEVDLGSTINCWGLNTYGQLGNNSTTDSATAVAVNTGGVLSGKSITAVASGANHSCALTSEGLVYCWGYGAFGSLGNNSTANSSVPVAVNTSGVLSGKTVVDIAAGLYHTCAITSDKGLYCWGYNNYGQLGNGSTTNSSVPVAVTYSGALSGVTVTAVTGGYYHTCALKSDGTVACWGRNVDGQLGRGNTTDSTTPVAVSTSGVLSGKKLAVIASLYNHTCGVSTEGLGYCWGDGLYGQMGNGGSSDATSPVAVSTSGVLTGKKLMMISAGYYHSCAVTVDDVAYCWGQNLYDQLGNGTTTNSLLPVAVVMP